jgi:hypothetical protein
MTKTMLPVSEVIFKNIENTAEKDEYFNAKDIFGCYTLDIIITCGKYILNTRKNEIKTNNISFKGFGVQTDALNESDHIFIKCLKGLLLSTLSPKFLLIGKPI